MTKTRQQKKEEYFEHYETENATITRILGENAQDYKKLWEADGKVIKIEISDPRVETFSINLYGNWETINHRYNNNIPLVYYKGKLEDFGPGLKIMQIEMGWEAGKIVQKLAERFEQYGVRISITTREDLIKNVMEQKSGKIVPKKGIFPGHEKYLKGV